MSVYVTIDLDYWIDHSGTNDSNQFFQKVFSLDCPKVVVASHESVVRYANKAKCRTIYNIDYHSDIVNSHGYTEMRFDEGTWANYIKWRKHGTFIWKHPHRYSNLEDGYCHSPMEQGYNPFDKAEYAGWQTVRRSKGLAGIPWDDVVEICICLSPDWTVVESVKDVLRTIGREDWLDWLQDNDTLYWPSIFWPKSYRLSPLLIGSYH